MRYGDLIRDAFRISWRNKFLWFFGFFAALTSFQGGGGGGSGGGGSNDSQSFNFSGSGIGELSSFSAGTFSDPTASVKSLAAAIPLMFQSDNTALLFIAFALVVVLLIVIFIAMNLLSQAALAEGVASIKGGSTRRFGQSFGIGLSYLLKLFLQAILFLLLAFSIFVLIAIVAGLPILLTFLFSQSVGLRIAMAVIFGIIGVLLLVVLFVSLAIVSQLAIRELVVGGNGIVGSIGSAFRLFRVRLGSVLLVWLLNIGLKIGIGIAFLLAALLVGLILVGPGIGIAVSGARTAGIIVGVIGGVVFLAAVIVVSGAIGTFIHAYWTLAYLQLTGRDVQPEARPVQVQ